MRAVRTMVMLCVVLVMAAGAWAAPAKVLQAKGSIEAVTVYRGEALVTRVIPLDAPAGPVDLTVTDLPVQIRPNSVFASGDGGVQIRAVQFRTRAVPREPREDLRKLDTAIEDVQRSIRQNETQQKVLAQKETYLLTLEKFTAEKVVDEKSRGKLDMAQLKQATEYVFAQRSKLADEKLKLDEKQRELKEKLSVLERERKQLAGKSAPTVREAILFIDKRAAGKATVRLNYMVGGATWSPNYNLRCGADGKQVTLEYNSLVQQMSGEDWAGVQLTLSTASPTMVSEAPVLTPLWVTLRPNNPKKPSAAELLLGGQRAAGENLRKALRQRGQQGQIDLAQDWDVNKWADQLQMMDIQAGRDVLMAGKEQARAEQALSVSYSLPGRISVPSRSDQQMIQISSLKLQGRLYHLAVPLLTASVYQHAEIVNTSDLALLTGNVSAYLDGQFMGTGRIPMVAKGQTFTVGFGVDSQLRATRELADKVDKIQGGNREINFKYRLLIENYKDQQVRVRLVDRLPDPRGADIRITLGELSDKLSEEPIYLRTIRKMGILQWEIDVPPKAAREKARTVEYEFKMEFDRNLAIGEPGTAELEKGKARFRRSHEAMLAH